MMEQGSLADLLTLAKSGDDNKLGEMMAMMNGGMGGQQWMWWILIILFAFGGFGNGMFGRNMAPNIERSTNAAQRATDALSHQLSDCCCQTQLRMQDLATGIREQATANQFQNQQEFCDIKTAWPPTIVKRLLPFRLIRRRSLVT